MNYHFTPKSSNSKTGAIPVTVSPRSTCPPSCPFMGAGCYAEAGFYTKLHWNKVSSGERGGTFQELCDSIASLKPSTLWRHDIAGDLPGKGERIHHGMLNKLVRANKGKRGFTYTHKQPNKYRNGHAIKAANDGGFTVNLSANNLAHADELAALDIGPVVAVVPESWSGNGETPQGRKVIQCPATARDDITCKDCGLCQWSNRKAVIAFPAHGSAKRAAERIALEGACAK